LDTCLLENLAHGRVVRKLVSYYVATRWQPYAELAMEMQEHLALPHHEHRNREVPAGSL
jgi:hypothetical protein